jgi:hypothetical protein
MVRPTQKGVVMDRLSIFKPVLRLQIALVFVIFLTASSSSQKAAGTALQAEGGNTAVEENHLIVHEWGTFTSIAGINGAALEWRPLNGASDLPTFVYKMNKDSVKGLRHNYISKNSLESLIRMETPVIYFYADRETVVSAKVDFPSGKITEWFPQARSVDTGINWGRFTVLPNAKMPLPVEPRDSHYYPARETDANILRICGTRQIEHEKFLFYRGVGNFNPPMNVRLEGDKLWLKNLQDLEVRQAVIFENRNGRTGYRVVNLLTNETTIPLSSVNQNQDLLEHDLEKMLVAEGLFEKEAKAMIKTWRGSWFEEGLRIFYILPRQITDTILPIQIEPLPTNLVRVMVCRTEIITPEMEASIRASIVNLDSPSAEQRLAAKQTIDKYGRFAEPILKRVMQKTTDSVLQLRIARLIKSSPR